jgi:DNA-binding transcriptional LysR family regulator
MDRKWLPLNALRAFEAAGQHLSFTAAANKLTVAQSAVSRHVIMLEQFLNTQLFERRPQQLALTEAGKHLLPIVIKSFDRIDQALTDIVKERGSLKRVLKVALPPTFAHQLAVPILKDFRAEHPDVSIDIASRAASASDGEVDLAVVYSEPKVTDNVLDLLWMARLTVLCSPALLAQGKPADIADFAAAHDLLHVKLEDRPRHYLWEMLARAVARPDLAVNRGPVFDTAQLAAQYAMSGEGLALVDPMLFREEIASGRLAQPFDFYLDDGYGYYLTTHAEDLGSEAIALFRSWMIRRFAAKRQ